MKTASVVMLVLGVVSGALYLLFGNDVALWVKIALKVLPTLLMCCWLIMMKIDKVNWPIFVGLIFSMLCDIAMALTGQLFLAAGIVANMLGLIFYIVYFVKTDHGLDLIRVVPGFIIIGVLYFVLFDYLGAFRIPVLIYCVIYVVFMWRATARLGDRTISKLSQYVCFIGSILVTVSDCLLSLLIFAVIPEKAKYSGMVMLLWWSGLLMLMLTAEIKRRNMRKLRAEKIA
jgi:Predicted membrane protein